MTQASNDYCIVLTTTSDEAHAETLATSLCQSKLAACVQIQKIKSFYTWKDQQCSEAEYLLLIKTRADLYSKIEEFILKNHHYETPEIIQIPIQNGSSAYLNWVNDSTS